MPYPEAMTKLLAELEKLPGVGPRTAERLGNHLVQSGPEQSLALARALEACASSVHPCSSCFHLSDRDPCSICSDPKRDRSRILVVEQSRDLEAMERAGWRGLYHVLQGSVRADEDATRSLTLAALKRRLLAGGVTELVLGTDPDFEGDGTALVVAELVDKLGARLKVSRLARGVPTGTAIEYTNPAVLAEALSERTSFRREGAP